MSRHVVLGVHLDEHKRAEKDESVPRSAPGRLVVERSFRHQSTVHGLEDPDAGDGPERAERVAWTSWAAKRPTSSASRSLRQSTGFHRAMRPGPDAARQPARLSATAALRAVQAPRALSVHTRDTVGVTSAMRSTKNRSQSSRVVSACLPLSPARVLGPSPQGRKDLSTSPTDDCDHGKGPRLSDVTASPCQEGFWRGGTLYLANETDGGRAGGGGFGKAWGMRTSCEKGQWSGRWRTSSAAESDGMRRQAERQARGSDGQERRGARSSSQEPGPGRPHVRRGAASTSKALGDMPAGESSPPKVGRQMNRGQLHAPEPQAALAPDHLGSEGVEGTRNCGEGGAVQVHFARFGKDALAPGGAARVALHGCGLLELPRELLAAPRDGGARATLQHLSLAWNTLAALPPEISVLSALRTLDVSFNRLVHLPAELAQLSRLEALDLSDNRLARLPRRLAPSHAPGRVPACFPGLQRLALLNLSYNRFEALSAELLRLPWLKQLDVRGNPLPPAAGTLPSDDPAAIIHASCSSVKYAGKEDGHSTGPSSGAAPRPAISAASVDDVQSGHSDRDDVEGWGWRRTQARMPLQSDVMRAGEDPAASGGGGGEEDSSAGEADEAEADSVRVRRLLKRAGGDSLLEAFDRAMEH